MPKTSKKRAPPPRRVDRALQLEWAERISAYLAADGMAPIAGRVLGWLMICDEPEQTPQAIAEALQVSRASLTTTFRILALMGLVVRRTRPGVRSAHYRVAPDAWEAVVRRQIASLGAFRGLLRDGLALVGPGAAQAAGLRAADDVFGWMTDAFKRAPPLPSGRRLVGPEQE